MNNAHKSFFPHNCSTNAESDRMINRSDHDAYTVTLSTALVFALVYWIYKIQIILKSCGSINYVVPVAYFCSTCYIICAMVSHHNTLQYKDFAKDNQIFQ
jgi:hypothetical protein